MNEKSRYFLESISAVSEKDVDPQIKSLFDDIKNTLEVPFVNLIWRHLATIPDGLSLTWKLAKPLYSSAVLDEAARSLREHSTLKKRLAPWPQPVQQALGLSASDHSEIISLIEDYGHANARALLILSYLHRSISAHTDDHATNAHQNKNAVVQLDPLSHKLKQGDRLINPARPLPAPSDLTACVADLVKILNTFAAPIPSPAEPSLYRHLSYWPSFLGAFWLAVEPLEREGLLAQEAINIHERASFIVKQWIPAQYDLKEIDARSVKEILHSIDHFTYAVIGRMIVLGDMMKRMLD